MARYADSNGFKADETRPNMWRYRDYVISAFNSDKPYDRFVKEQVAGDELYPGDPEALTAMGFNRNWIDETNAAALYTRRQETLDDMTTVTGVAFMGIAAEDFLAAVKSGKSDSAMLEWVNANTKPVRQSWEIAAWSHWLENLAPGDARRHATFAEEMTRSCPQREDIRTLFDRLDMDDYVTFGGAA